MRRIAPMVVAFLAIAAAGGAASTPDAGRGAEATPVTSLDGGYFSGEGFATHPESYAAQDKQSFATVAATAAAVGKDAQQSRGAAAGGHRFAPAEDLYYTGAGFTSRAK